MERHNVTEKLTTISRWVREHRMTEKDALLLRGTASARGFRGRLFECLDWLEDRSPGAKARYYGERFKAWKRNVGQSHAVLLSQGRVRLRQSPGRPSVPPSNVRCTARAKLTGERCKNYGHRWPDGTRNRVCRYHGALGAPHGIKGWRKVMKWTGTKHERVWVRCKKSER